MSEGKDVVVQENVNENIVESKTELVNEMGNDNVLNESFQPVNNTFLYSAPSVEYTTGREYFAPMEKAAESQDLPLVNNLLVEEGNGVSVDSELVEIGNIISTDNKVVQNESIETTVEEKNIIREEDIMDKELKSNLTFIIVLAAIMVAMVIALPYI